MAGGSLAGLSISDFMGLWIMSEREARRAAVSCIRVSSGGGTKEEELTLLEGNWRRSVVLQAAGRLGTLDCVERRFEALDVVGRPTALKCAGWRLGFAVLEFAWALAELEKRFVALCSILVALEMVGMGLDERIPGMGMELDCATRPEPGL